MNIVLLTDSYKMGHHVMYPEGTEAVYSYFESRTGATYSNTVFFGLQYLLKEYLTGVRVTQQDILEAADFCKQHFGTDAFFNKKMWQHIVDRYEGRLPVRILAVPEGMPIPTGNVLMTVENTDPECAALTNHLETLLSQLWYPSTVATLSRKVKLMINRFLQETGSDKGGLDFMLHDFGYRGVSSVESAGIGGAAHLVNFKGTDTIHAIETTSKYYYSGICAFSVPATEHSVMTAYGPEREAEVVQHLLSMFPKGILSVVGDSYDIFHFCDHIVGNVFKQAILNRDGVFVVRPDSGDPVSTVLRCLDILYARMGGSVNAAGFKQLNPKIKLLWGDGLEYDKIYDILLSMKNAGWAASNIATFGMGGGLLQKVNRDTQRFAFKSSAQKRNGIWYDIYKEPVDKSKMSKKGRLALVREGDLFHTIPEKDLGGRTNLLQPVFDTGHLLRDVDFTQVRENATI
jgi:nicotinamide phosphoribosyltransferase